MAERAGPASVTRPYRALLGARVRAQSSYRSSFALDLVSSLLVGLVELVEVWVLYRAVHEIGGLDLASVLLVFGLAETAFSIADLLVGHVDTLPQYLRAGTFDVFCLRPQPLLAQLITSDISLRRLSRVAVGVTVLIVGLRANDVAFTPANLLLLLLTLLSGTAICTGVFVVASGVQFFLIDAAEMTNSVVYGGRYASTQPGSVWTRPVVALFGFAVPMAFTGYLPTLTLLGLPTPWNLPSWAGWLAPLAGVWTWGLAWLSWRVGTRHYQGGGG